MPKLTDYKKIYDPADFGLSDDKNKVVTAIADSRSATTFFLSNQRSAVYVANSPSEPLQYLFTTNSLFDRVVPTIAKFIGFSKTQELGFYSLSASKDLALITPDTPWGTGQHDRCGREYRGILQRQAAPRPR